MGRGGGKKWKEFSIYDHSINDENQWETMLMIKVKRKRKYSVDASSYKMSNFYSSFNFD